MVLDCCSEDLRGTVAGELMNQHASAAQSQHSFSFKVQHFYHSSHFTARYSEGFPCCFCYELKVSLKVKNKTGFKRFDVVPESEWWWQRSRLHWSRQLIQLCRQTLMFVLMGWWSGCRISLKMSLIPPSSHLFLNHILLPYVGQIWHKDKTKVKVTRSYFIELSLLSIVGKWLMIIFFLTPGIFRRN